ncbi:MAG: hypothetical protein OJF48_003438 [Afipia sp.]|jgi:poly-gamma-glutamate capsule biosynthesis protein CapA/YwtB (metallophosphatase superfamily)|nr:MAG: hypothetical protein OJF48_003438 [Afipia sp.]
MNRTRRKQITSIIDAIEQAKADLDLVKDEEQDAFDNLPESIQDSERGHRMTAAIEAIDEAFEAIDTALNALESAKE